MDARKVLRFKKGATKPEEREEEEDTEMDVGSQPAGIDVVSLLLLCPLLGRLVFLSSIPQYQPPNVGDGPADQT